MKLEDDLVSEGKRCFVEVDAVAEVCTGDNRSECGIVADSTHKDENVGVGCVDDGGARDHVGVPSRPVITFRDEGCVIIWLAKFVAHADGDEISPVGTLDF